MTIFALLFYPSWACFYFVVATNKRSKEDAVVLLSITTSSPLANSAHSPRRQGSKGKKRKETRIKSVESWHSRCPGVFLQRRTRVRTIFFLCVFVSLSFCLFLSFFPFFLYLYYISFPPHSKICPPNLHFRYSFSSYTTLYKAMLPSASVPG